MICTGVHLALKKKTNMDYYEIHLDIVSQYFYRNYDESKLVTFDIALPCVQYLHSDKLH